MRGTEPTAPERVGRYRLLDRLAIGGMAEVFLASDANAGGRVVVIKRLLPHLAHDDEFIRAFAREAEFGRRIAHPNVVAVFDHGDDDGLPYLAMEYVAGSSLRELVSAATDAGRLLPIDVALALFVQACEGAHAAHELTDEAGQPYGLVHRDLTPHNLMVTDDGRVKLLDFGIAKANDGDDQTRTGVLKGKIAYMSPEQCRQERLDRRSDVFSLGVLGYQLLACDKPFRSASELATMQAIVTGRHVPLRSARPEVPDAVADVIERAMAHHVDDRYDTAHALAEAVSAAADATGHRPDPERTAGTVSELVGDAHARRTAAIAAALDDLTHPLSAYVPLVTESLEAEPPSAHQRPHPVGHAAALAPPPVPRRSVAPILGFALAFGLVLATLAWVWRSQPVIAGAPVLVALAPTMAPDALRSDFEPVRAYLSQRLDRPIELEIRASYRETADALVTGAVPYAVLPPNTARRALEREPRLIVLAVKQIDGSTSSDGFLLVRRAEPIPDAESLAGKVICFTDAWSSTGYLMPRAYLERHGIDVDTEMTVHWSGNHEQALRDLLAGTCDAAATFSGNYETAALRGLPTAQLRILAVTGNSAHDAVVASPNADPAVTAALASALLGFSGAGDHDAEAERITGFATPPAGYPEP